MRRSQVIALLLVAVVVAAVASSRSGLIPSRYDPLAPLDLADPPNPVTALKLWRLDGDTPSCLASLRHAGLQVTEMPRRIDRRECVRDGTVTLSRLWRASLATDEMGCGIALRLYLFDRHDLQPLAQRHFGSRITRIEHFGSYSCRTIAGSNRMSEHATANAFDIAGFRLADGRLISLKRDWDDGGGGKFLRDVRARLCLLFNMVLSPDYNDAHADHFHVDMGRFMGCH